MPKKPVRTSANGPTPAAALIAAAKSTAASERLSAEAVRALRLLAEHNDTLPRNASRGRVSASTAINMLREHYGVSLAAASRASFDALCRRELGRASWGTK